MAGLYESRTPSYVFFFGLICGFAATNSRLYYDQVPLVINSGYAQDSRGLATCEPLRCGFAATNSRLYYNRVPLVINSGYVQASRGTPVGRPLQNRSQAMKNDYCPLAIKYTRPLALCVGADPNRAARCKIQP